ncbi:hypothetical protein BVG16_07235 [Paenibacillus selenitireducens]|uniref:Uncharacterized protein n=1 Tax=Paenibacillus selenitireducens TaxID=1324314 RepID=A0A1T2XL09_9BACL|nr:UPF0158 family protein [Paenibacillus selenitireducens]OPA80512.1 hypothetical protein BVG16_07235 [Paenibacillus selenitireducens]
MHKPINLQGIIDGLEMQMDGTSIYLNLKTGEVISVSDEDIRTAEEDEPFDHLPDWQQEAINAVIDILENFDDYEELPTKFEINEYEMMEDFCCEIKDQRNKEQLLDAIRGRGAFRRFKDQVHYLGIEQEWYAYRDERYKQIAIDWCKDYNLKYIE